MQLAFYAPLKPPTDPVASGDRTVARNLLAALALTGAVTEIASVLKSRDAAGDEEVQRKITDAAARAVPQIVQRGRAAEWQAWITYHNYYKAPDLIGPAVTKTLGIPYLIVEASRARSRLDGPWARFAQSAEAACDAADVIFYLTERDHRALEAYAPARQTLVHLRPFLARSQLPQMASGSGLLAVGMMREAAKLPSYHLIAQTLALLPRDVHLAIAGDGPARVQVETAMAPFGGRVQFLGALGDTALKRAYRSASALIWPGVDEAFGMSYLEAQAFGLPVIAQDRDGVRDVLYPRAYPAPATGAAGLAAFAQQAVPEAGDIRAYMAKHHLLPSAADTLRQGLSRAGVR